MPVTPSKVKSGTLTLGGASPTDFSCSPTNIRLTPSVNTEDPLEVLCGDVIQGIGSTTWSLDGTAVSDFDDPNGFVLYAFHQNGETVPFTWQPNPQSGTWSGSVVIAAIEIGGDINTRLTTDFSFGVVGQLTLTPVTP